MARIDDDQPQMAKLRAKAEHDQAVAKAASDVDVRYSQKAQAVAQKASEKAEQSHKAVQGSVTDVERDRLRLEWEKSGLQIEQAQLDRQLACTDTTSMGRLFDAVASLTGVRQSIDYEAEAALNLEAIAAAEEAATTDRPYLLPTHAAVAGPITIDWRPLVRAVVADVEAGESPGSMAARFHAAVTRMIVETCILLRDRGAGTTVGLTGGVFQNAWLVERSLDGLHAAGFEVLTHHAVPPNDGGLALGGFLLCDGKVP
jgi:hydrogenase maturation factor HypF (carbamoyltransferase family)